LVEMAHEAETQAVYITLERGAIVADRAVGAGRVASVVTGHRLQHDRAILGGPGKGPRMVKRKGERQDAHAADQPVGRLNTGEAAKRGRAADRSSGVAAGAAEHEPGRDRGAGAAGGTAGEAAQIPRIARRRPGQIERGSAEGELVGRELAEDDRAGI